PLAQPPVRLVPPAYPSLSPLPPPPRSPLFPYTPLFRSVLGHGDVVDAAHHFHIRVPTQKLQWLFRSSDMRQCQATTLLVQLPHKDRKSTRLNSSHGSISYAVFCLKKKTTSPNSTPIRIN